MIDLTLDAIQKYLETLKLDVKRQPETDQLFVVFKYEDFEFPLFIRVFPDSQLLQFLLFIPFSTQPGTNAEVARLLHLLNKELDIPGFGMDESTKLIFYRIMIPATNSQIHSEIIKAYIGTVENVFKTFTPVIANVASGQAKFDEVLKKIKESQPKS